jgi:hypothetical protein
MKKIAILVTLVVASIAYGQSAVESAKTLLTDRMASELGEVAVTWGPTLSWQAGDEVSVVGFGIVQKGAERTQGVFSFDVHMYTRRRMAPKIQYTIHRWGNQGAVNEKYLSNLAQIAVRQRIETDARSEMRLDFTKQDVSKAKPDGWAVTGSGTYSARGGFFTGAFTFVVQFNEPLGSVRSVSVTPLGSNPGIGMGGQHNALTESAAQQYARDYVRSKEGSSVQVQFTGPVTHIAITKEIDRVSGRGQWRRGDNFQWADFRYDVQVSMESGKVFDGTVNIVPDIHGGAEDQKFVSFAQIAVRRDFREQSPAQISFLSGTVKALPFGKKSVSGEFSAGGKRYGYEVILEASNGRSERVTITPRR